MDKNFQIKKDKLLDLLSRKGISDSNVLKAISNIPREKFISADLSDKSYEDTALPIICKQTISQPFTVAFMTQCLDVKPGMKVLEIGTGSGYQAAILVEMGANLYSIESIPELYEYSNKILTSLNYDIHQKIADGTLGWEDESPFDRIIVTAGAPHIPKGLLVQLRVGGKLVIPIGDKFTQIMYIVEKLSDENFKTSTHNSFRFVPLIGKDGWKK